MHKISKSFWTTLIDCHQVRVFARSRVRLWGSRFRHLLRQRDRHVKGHQSLHLHRSHVARGHPQLWQVRTGPEFLFLIGPRPFFCSQSKIFLKASFMLCFVGPLILISTSFFNLYFDLFHEFWTFMTYLDSKHNFILKNDILPSNHRNLSLKLKISWGTLVN